MLSCEYCKISKNSFLYRAPLMAASELKSNFSNVSLNKSKKKLAWKLGLEIHDSRINVHKKRIMYCKNNNRMLECTHPVILDLMWTDSILCPKCKKWMHLKCTNFKGFIKEDLNVAGLPQILENHYFFFQKVF